MKQYKIILKRNIWAVAGVSLLTVLASFAMVYAGYSLSFLFDAYEASGDRIMALVTTFLQVLGIWLGAMLLYYLALLARARIKMKLKGDLREMISGKIAGMSYADFSGQDSGGIVSWLTGDVDQLYQQSFSSLFTCIEELSSAIFSLVALVSLSWYVGLVAVVLLAAITILPQFTGKRLQKANTRRSRAQEVSVEGYKDTIMGAPVFFLSGLRRRIAQRVSRTSAVAEREFFRYDCCNTSAQILISTVSMVGQIVLLFLTLVAAVFGLANGGAALSVGNLSGSFFNGVSGLMQGYMTIKASKPLWEKFRQEADPMPRTRLEDFTTIRLKDLSFRYGERTVLRDQNLTFCSGEKYAIMGESGSGKTTLTRIVLGLLPGYTGEVCYGSIEQRRADLSGLYSQVAYVDQQVYLFQDTLRFNITLGRDYTEEEIMDVVRRCRLERFVASLPQGLDTMISENGKNLSGGQRQRIALARGLIRKVRFLILDEGTSALDEENAVDIEKSLVSQKDLCVIFITHHLRCGIRDKLTAIYHLNAEDPADHEKQSA